MRDMRSATPEVRSRDAAIKNGSKAGIMLVSQHDMAEEAPPAAADGKNSIRMVNAAHSSINMVYLDLIFEIV